MSKSREANIAGWFIASAVSLGFIATDPAVSQTVTKGAKNALFGVCEPRIDPNAPKSLNQKILESDFPHITYRDSLGPGFEDLLMQANFSTWAKTKADDGYSIRIVDYGKHGLPIHINLNENQGLAIFDLPDKSASVISFESGQKNSKYSAGLELYKDGQMQESWLMDYFYDPADPKNGQTGFLPNQIGPDYDNCGKPNPDKRSHITTHTPSSVINFDYNPYAQYEIRTKQETIEAPGEEKIIANNTMFRNWARSQEEKGKIVIIYANRPAFEGDVVSDEAVPYYALPSIDSEVIQSGEWLQPGQHTSWDYYVQVVDENSDDENTTEGYLVKLADANDPGLTPNLQWFAQQDGKVPLFAPRSHPKYPNNLIETTVEGALRENRLIYDPNAIYVDYLPPVPYQKLFGPPDPNAPKELRSADEDFVPKITHRHYLTERIENLVTYGKFAQEAGKVISQGYSYRVVDFGDQQFLRAKRKPSNVILQTFDIPGAGGDAHSRDKWLDRDTDIEYSFDLEVEEYQDDQLRGVWARLHLDSRDWVKIQDGADPKDLLFDITEYPNAATKTTFDFDPSAIYESDLDSVTPIAPEAADMANNGYFNGWSKEIQDKGGKVEIKTYRDDAIGKVISPLGVRWRLTPSAEYELPNVILQPNQHIGWMTEVVVTDKDGATSRWLVNYIDRKNENVPDWYSNDDRAKKVPIFAAIDYPEYDQPLIERQNKPDVKDYVMHNYDTYYKGVESFRLPEKPTNIDLILRAPDFHNWEEAAFAAGNEIEIIELDQPVEAKAVEELGIIKRWGPDGNRSSQDLLENGQTFSTQYEFIQLQDGQPIKTWLALDKPFEFGDAMSVGVAAAQIEDGNNEPAVLIDFPNPRHKTVYKVTRSGVKILEN